MTKLSSETLKLACGLFSLASLWFLLLYQLSVSWDTNEQYAHGFLVPFLCFFLLLKKPATNAKSETISHSVHVRFCYMLGVPLLLSLVPIWLIRGGNSDWRLLNLGLFIIIFSLSLIPFSFGKNKILGLKSFIFPLSFFLVAIPWPLSTDLQLTQWLQVKVSKTIVDFLLLLEHQASLEGTVIDVGVFGKIGIDQACSGINGLQASVVVSLFLGAYFGFSTINRILLCFSGLLVAVFFNLSRAFSLAFIKIKGKGELLEKPILSFGDFNFPNLHDFAGSIETALIFISILLIVKIAKPHGLPETLSNNDLDWSKFKIAPPLGFSLFSTLLTSVTVIGTEYHYLNYEKNMEVVPKIAMNLEDSGLLIQENDISKQVSLQLHYEEARSFQWQDKFRSRLTFFGTSEINPNAEYWQGFEAMWSSGGACTAILSTHSPESCLPLTGLTQIDPAPGQKPKLIAVNVSGNKISFEAYEFSRNQRKLFVFRCFWPHLQLPGETNQFPFGGYNFDGRIKAAIEGRRNVGGTMLALAIANVSSFNIAETKLKALVKQRLRLQKHTIN